jgi:hypothetical protein
MDPDRLRLLLLTCLLAAVPMAGEPVVGYMAGNGVISLNDADGNLLEITPAAWGPKWG